VTRALVGSCRAEFEYAGAGAFVHIDLVLGETTLSDHYLTDTGISGLMSLRWYRSSADWRVVPADELPQ
jgi:hypothetical protein